MRFHTSSECCWGRLAFEKKTLALRGRRAALVAPVRERFQRQPALSTVAGFIRGGGDSSQRSNGSPLSRADGFFRRSFFITVIPGYDSLSSSVTYVGQVTLSLSLRWGIGRAANDATLSNVDVSNVSHHKPHNPSKIELVLPEPEGSDYSTIKLKCKIQFGLGARKFRNLFLKVWTKVEGEGGSELLENYFLLRKHFYNLHHKDLPRVLKRWLKRTMVDVL
ncbi:hypothetical protein LR48_Vigan06g094700 [Vigna angularis]|uniref:Uncharacterized protein n=1 Tax=Phaseolus angularis TaxID=3914 RepID=A0A0L9USD7_PHAAN|nr:hypothetical protein LR48_Vigan06g094700 [Vigna angularis]